MQKKKSNTTKKRNFRKGKNRSVVGAKHLHYYYTALIVLLVIAASFAAISISHINIFGNFDAVHPATTNTSNIYNKTTTNAAKTLGDNSINQTLLAAQVIPTTGYTLPFKWGDSVHKLVEAGALNVSNLTIILNNSRQPLTLSEKEILNGTYTGYIQFNSTNTEFVQLVLWGLGINNNNTIITKGPIINASIPYANSINTNSTLRQKLNQNATPQWVASQYFASTGGYGPLGKLQLGELNIVSLNSQQQALMYDVATRSYRPCCDNPTAFPDCNHGAAALGLIELLAYQGANQSQMFDAVRYFYQYQFPQQYAEIAAYFDSHGVNYNQVNSSEVMGYSFSSYSGYASVNQYLIKNKILAQPSGGGASCGA
jgi:hypothetical protein